MKTKKIFLCRHAETDMNKSRLWSGRTDAELNENGIVQAQILGKKLRHYPIEAVYSSELKRSKQTAAEIARCFNLDIRIDKRLNEADYGKAEGLSFSEVEQTWPQTREYWINPIPSHFDSRFPDGESIEEVQKRCLNVLNDIALYSPYRNIAVVTHAGVICSFLASLSILRPRVPNCDVVPLAYDGKVFISGKIF